MNPLKSLPIGVKVLAAPLLALILMFVIAAMAIIGSQRQNKSTEVILKEYLPTLNLLAETEKYLALSLGNVHEIISMLAFKNADPKVIEGHVKRLTSALDLLKKNLETISRNPTMGKSQKDEIERLQTLLGMYRRIIDDTLEIALAQPQMATSYIPSIKSCFDQFFQPMSEFTAIQHRRSQEAYDQAQAIAAKIRMITIATALISMLLALIVTFIVRKNMLSSVQKIRDAVVGLSRGDLRTRVALEGKDEIAETAHAINQFIDGMHRVVSGVSEGSTLLTHAASELIAISTSVAQGSAHQSDAASTVAATVEQMTVTVASIAENAELLRKASHNSLQCTETGDQNLRKLTDGISGVERAFNAINASVGEFVVSATSITNMTKQVKELAEQTNLLALNAAIEAARAGEQGRGFSVVADEVRKLAERSAQAASDIDAVTAAISQKSGGVDQSLLDGTQSLAFCKKHVDALESVFAQARESVQGAAQGVEDIADSVREQSAGSTDMARNIDNIARMAEENSAAATRSLEAVRSLDTLANSLQSSISVFST